jgi:hypothetical protein
VIDLPSHHQRRLIAEDPGGRERVQSIYDPETDAIVGWDRLCHFCGLAQFYVWDASTGRRRGGDIRVSPVGKYAITWGGILGATTLRDGDRSRVVALVDVGRSVGDPDLLFIDPKSGAVVRRIRTRGLSSLSGPLAASPRGDRLAATVSRGGVVILDPATGRRLVQPVHPYPDDSVESLAFASADRLVVAYGKSGLVVLDSDSGREIGVPVRLNGTPTDVVADPTHHRLVVRITNETNGSALIAIPDVLLADAAPASLVQTGCSMLGRNLTSSEWEALFGGATRRRTCTGLPLDSPELVSRAIR